MKVCLIVNPNAGKNRGAGVAEESRRMLNERGVDVEIVHTEGPRHAVEIAGSLAIDTYDGVIAVGGDGTLFEVVNGIMQAGLATRTILGQIPVGTGNSFIKDLFVENLEDAIDKIVDGHTTNVDVGKLTCSDGEYYFVNLLGAGFVSNVAYRAKKYKAFGSLSYIFGVFEELVVLKATPSKLVVDGVTYERDLIFIEICNSKFTGGNMMMAPGARIDDGEFDVVLLNTITRRRLLKLFPRIFNGTHVDDASAEVIRGKSIQFTTQTPLALVPDGETFGTTPIKVEMLPGAIRMFGRA